MNRKLNFFPFRIDTKVDGSTKGKPEKMQRGLFCLKTEVACPNFLFLCSFLATMPEIDFTKTIIAVQSTTLALQKHFKNKGLVNSNEGKRIKTLVKLPFPDQAPFLCLLQITGKDFTILLF